MRRKQRELLKRAKEGGISEALINQYLKDENKTEAELNRLYNQLRDCKDKDDDWIMTYMGIEDYNLKCYIKEYKNNVSYEVLCQINTYDKFDRYMESIGMPCYNDLMREMCLILLPKKNREQIYRYYLRFIEEQVINADFFKGKDERETLMENKGNVSNLAYCMEMIYERCPMSNNILKSLRDLIKLYQTMNETEFNKLLGVMSKDKYYNIIDSLVYCGEFKSFLYYRLMYRYKRNLKWMKMLTKTVNDLPIKIFSLKKNAEDLGYDIYVDKNGYERSAEINDCQTYFVINYNHYCNVRVAAPYIDEDDDEYSEPNAEVYLQKDDENSPRNVSIIFFFDTERFVTKFNYGYKKRKTSYRDTTLKELFEIVSFRENTELTSSLISFLCQRYGTMIFKDLYEDYKSSGVLLLPITVEEAGQYHSKDELIKKKYKLTLPGNWNTRNVNFAYSVSKIQKRLSDQALAHIMQNKNYLKINLLTCSNRYNAKPNYFHAFHVYSCLYGRCINDEYIVYGAAVDDNTLYDAICEEYDQKDLQMDSPRRTSNAHLERHEQEERRNIPVKISENTVFKTLIESMPAEYELIKDADRLWAEKVMQHNCVYNNYGWNIIRDESMIYSTVYEGKRHTIEIVKEYKEYKLEQCLKACNAEGNPELIKKLTKTLKEITRKEQKALNQAV